MSICTSLFVATQLPFLDAQALGLRSKLDLQAHVQGPSWKAPDISFACFCCKWGFWFCMPHSIEVYICLFPDRTFLSAFLTSVIGIPGVHRVRGTFQIYRSNEQVHQTWNIFIKGLYRVKEVLTSIHFKWKFFPNWMCWIKSNKKCRMLSSRSPFIHVGKLFATNGALHIHHPLLLSSHLSWRLRDSPLLQSDLAVLIFMWCFWFTSDMLVKSSDDSQSNPIHLIRVQPRMQQSSPVISVPKSDFEAERINKVVVGDFWFSE